MRAGAVLLSLVLSAPAAAESVAVMVVSASELTEGQQQALVESAEGALRKLSSLSVKEQGRKALLTGPKKRCGADVDCLVALAQALKTDHALMLSLSLSAGQLRTSGFWVDGARRTTVYRQPPPSQGNDLDAAAATLVEQVLPGFVRKGWGGIDVDAPPGTAVKVDGRKVATTPVELPVPATEGVHEVDLVLPDGTAFLQRVSVTDGRRERLSAPDRGLFSSGPASEGSTLQAVSYGLWTAGAIAIAGSLVAGALGVRAAADVRACQGGDRSCTEYLDAQLKLRQSQDLATTANVLLISGGLLAGGGAGLFAWDLVAPRGRK